MEITVNKDGQDLGPYTLEQLQAELDAGNLSSEDFAWFEGCEDWVTVTDVPGLGSSTAGGNDGVHVEKDGSPFPLPQIQAMLNQGELTVEDPAWIEGWGDWGVVGDLDGIKKPRVRVKAGGSPLSGIAPAAAGGADKKSRQEAKAEVSEEPEGKKAKRGRKRKAKRKKGGAMRIVGSVAALLILGVLGVVGYIVVKGMMEDDDPIDSLRDTFVKEDPPPEHDPWLLTQWRLDRQKS